MEVSNVTIITIFILGFPAKSRSIKFIRAVLISRSIILYGLIVVVHAIDALISRNDRS